MNSLEYTVGRPLNFENERDRHLFTTTTFSELYGEAFHKAINKTDLYTGKDENTTSSTCKYC